MRTVPITVSLWFVMRAAMACYASESATFCGLLSARKGQRGRVLYYKARAAVVHDRTLRELDALWARL